MAITSLPTQASVHEGLGSAQCESMEADKGSHEQVLARAEAGNDLGNVDYSSQK